MYLDNILITRTTKTEHLGYGTILECLAKAGLHLNREKCSFLLKKIEYLGYVINAPRNSQQEAAFIQAKTDLQADPLVMHFDPNKPLLLSVMLYSMALDLLLSFCCNQS